MKSKITGGDTSLLFEKKVLGKFDVKYFRCEDTGFIQTEDPYWLEESYSSAITKLDIGLPYRNIQQSEKFSKILSAYFDVGKKYLDFAGGYGLFTRLMRDRGFDFYHTDIYCKNIFAEYFEADLNHLNEKFELITAMEVFEHMKNPVEEIATLFSYSDSILFTTELQPGDESLWKDWWYFSFETGQHIALYHIKTLQYLADKFHCELYTDNHSTHLFTRKKLKSDPFRHQRDSFWVRKAKKFISKAEAKQNRPNSLLQHDFKYIQSILKQNETI